MTIRGKLKKVQKATDAVLTIGKAAVQATKDVDAVMGIVNDPVWYSVCPSEGKHPGKKCQCATCAPPFNCVVCHGETLVDGIRQCSGLGPVTNCAHYVLDEQQEAGIKEQGVTKSMAAQDRAAMNDQAFADLKAKHVAVRRALIKHIKALQEEVAKLKASDEQIRESNLKKFFVGDGLSNGIIAWEDKGPITTMKITIRAKHVEAKLERETIPVFVQAVAQATTKDETTLRITLENENVLVVKTGEVVAPVMQQPEKAREMLRAMPKAIKGSTEERVMDFIGP